MPSKAELILGRVAVAAKLISQEQLDQALAAQTPGRELAEVLLEQGALDAKGLKRAISLQHQVVQKSRAQAEAAPDAAAEAPAQTAKRAAAPRPAAPAPPPAAPPPPAQSAAPPAPELGEASDGAVSEQLAEEFVVEHTSMAEPATAASAPPVRAPLDHPLHKLLAEGVAAGASDIHVHSGAAVRFRKCGVLVAQGEDVTTPQAAQALLGHLLTSEQERAFQEHGEIDFAYTLEGVGRFRANVYRQLHGVDIVLRSIPAAPPTLKQLGLPEALARFTGFHQGMVLVTGPTRCGKSSTLAALVNLINEARREHILTIEDPIEVLHPSRQCLVNQRNVGPHTESFARALRGALREDPDVIVIGELRDLETIALALTAAETGHFVLASLHTDNAVRTVTRLIGAFPPDQQDQVRAMVTDSLKAVISQRLLPRADGQGQVAALEIMAMTRAIGNLVREQKTVQIRSALQTGQSQGMCLLDHSLAHLVKSGVVERDVALRAAEDPKLIP